MSQLAKYPVRQVLIRSVPIFTFDLNFYNFDQLIINPFINAHYVADLSRFNNFKAFSTRPHELNKLFAKFGNCMRGFHNSIVTFSPTCLTNYAQIDLKF